MAIVGFFVWRYMNSYEDTDDAEVDGHVNNVSARISGYILKVNVDDNQYVAKGAVLAEIDPRDYQLAVEKAKADLADAEATARAMNLNIPVETIGATSQVSSSEADLESAEAGVAAAQEQLDSARAQLAQAEANNTRAQQDAARYGALIAKGEVSQQVFDQAEASAKANAAAVDSARAAVAAAQQQVSQAKSHVNAGAGNPDNIRAPVRNRCKQRKRERGRQLRQYNRNSRRWIRRYWICSIARLQRRRRGWLTNTSRLG